MKINFLLLAFLISTSTFIKGQESSETGRTLGSPELTEVERPFTFRLQQRIFADPEADGEVPSHFAVFGQYLIIGMREYTYGEDQNKIEGMGKANIYKRNTEKNSWDFHQSLYPSDETVFRGFGSGTFISENYAVVQGEKQVGNERRTYKYYFYKKNTDETSPDGDWEEVTINNLPDLSKKQLMSILGDYLFFWGKGKIFPYKIQNDQLIAKEELEELLLEYNHYPLPIKERMVRGKRVSQFDPDEATEVTVFEFDENKGFVEMGQLHPPEDYQYGFGNPFSHFGIDGNYAVVTEFNYKPYFDKDQPAALVYKYDVDQKQWNFQDYLPSGLLLPSDKPRGTLGCTIKGDFIFLTEVVFSHEANVHFVTFVTVYKRNENGDKWEKVQSIEINNALGVYRWRPYLVESNGNYYCFEGHRKNGITLACYSLEEEHENDIPVASLTTDKSNGPASLVVNFDATASTDEDGSIIRYQWAFKRVGDDSSVEIVEGGGNQCYEFQTAGTYEVTLTVTDNSGATNTTTPTTITVEPAEEPASPEEPVVAEEPASTADATTDDCPEVAADRVPRPQLLPYGSEGRPTKNHVVANGDELHFEFVFIDFKDNPGTTFKGSDADEQLETYFNNAFLKITTTGGEFEEELKAQGFQGEVTASWSSNDSGWLRMGSGGEGAPAEGKNLYEYFSLKEGRMHSENERDYDFKYLDYVRDGLALLPQKEYDENTVVVFVPAEGLQGYKSRSANHSPTALFSLAGKDVHKNVRSAFTLGPKIYQSLFTTMLHELGHSFGLKDLYPEYEAEPGKYEHKIGGYAMMGDAKGTHGFLGWHRFRFGWLDKTRTRLLNTQGQQTINLKKLSGETGDAMIIIPDRNEFGKLYAIETGQDVYKYQFLDDGPVLGEVGGSEQGMDQAGNILSPENINLQEGLEQSFTVSLNKPISKKVVLTAVSESDEFAEVITGKEMTFDNTNWSTPQTVSIKGIENEVVQAPTFGIKINIDSRTTEEGFKDLAPQKVMVDWIDNDGADFTISPKKIEILEGNSASFDVVLNIKPSGDVLINASSEDQNITLDKKTLTFTPENWNVYQTIAVTALDDENATDETVKITFSIDEASEDQNYRGLKGKRMVGKVIDNNSFSVSASDLMVIEGEGGEAEFQVTLDKPPRGNVTISVSSDDTDIATVNESSLVFTASDWSTPKTLKITGVEDEDFKEEQVNITLDINETNADRDEAFDGGSEEEVAIKVRKKSPKILNQEGDRLIIYKIESHPDGGDSQTKRVSEKVIELVMRTPPEGEVKYDQLSTAWLDAVSYTPADYTVPASAGLPFTIDNLVKTDDGFDITISLPEKVDAGVYPETKMSPNEEYQIEYTQDLDIVIKEIDEDKVVFSAKQDLFGMTRGIGQMVILIAGELQLRNSVSGNWLKTFQPKRDFALNSTFAVSDEGELIIQSPDGSCWTPAVADLIPSPGDAETQSDYTIDRSQDDGNYSITGDDYQWDLKSKYLGRNGSVVYRDGKYITEDAHYQSNGRSIVVPSTAVPHVTADGEFQFIDGPCQEVVWQQFPDPRKFPSDEVGKYYLLDYQKDGNIVIKTCDVDGSTECQRVSDLKTDYFSGYEMEGWVEWNKDVGDIVLNPFDPSDFRIVRAQLQGVENGAKLGVGKDGKLQILDEEDRVVWPLSDGASDE